MSYFVIADVEQFYLSNHTLTIEFSFLRFLHLFSSGLLAYNLFTLVAMCGSVTRIMLAL